MFALTQALDNASRDVCLVDDRTLSTRAPEAEQHVTRLFDILAMGTHRAFGALTFTRVDSVLAVKVPTSTTDNLGRVSPLYVLVDTETATSSEELYEQVLMAARLLERNVAEDQLKADFERGLDWGKVRRGHRFRRIGRWLNHLLRRLQPRKRATRPAIGRDSSPPSSADERQILDDGN